MSFAIFLYIHVLFFFQITCVLLPYTILYPYPYPYPYPYLYLYLYLYPYPYPYPYPYDSIQWYSIQWHSIQWHNIQWHSYKSFTVNSGRCSILIVKHTQPIQMYMYDLYKRKVLFGTSLYGLSIYTTQNSKWDITMTISEVSDDQYYYIIVFITNWFDFVSWIDSVFREKVRLRVVCRVGDIWIGNQSILLIQYSTSIYCEKMIVICKCWL